jgi:cytochrome c oxidase subunit IV
MISPPTPTAPIRDVRSRSAEGGGSMNEAEPKQRIAVVPPHYLVAAAVGVIALMFAQILLTKFDLAQFDLGEFRIWGVIVIALMQTAIIAGVFMHLLWDRLFHTVIMLSAGGAVVLLLVMTVLLAIDDRTAVEAGAAPGVERALAPPEAPVE